MNTRIEYELTREDAAVAMRLAAERERARTPFGERALGLAAWLLVAMGIFVVMFAGTPNGAPAPGSTKALALLFLGMIVLGSLQSSLARRRAFESVLDASGPYPLHVTLGWDADALSLASRNARSAISWSAIAAVDVRAAHVAIYLGPGQALLVPKSAFADEEAATVFAQFAREAIARSRQQPGRAMSG